MPWGDNSTVSYNGNYGSGTDSSQVGYFSRVDDATHYQLNIGTSDKHTSVDGYYSHDGSLAQVDLSANYHEGQYTSAGLSLQGGATLTTHGGALHRTQNMGGTRLLIDADGVADVPVEGNGAAVYTNMFGKAVVSDVNNYYRNQAYIDLNKLPENAEATQSVVQATLTEGAIGYRKFAVISGQKAMAVLRLQDGSHPPFGAEVKNDNEQTVGLVDDDGSVYLAGVKPGEHMSVFWSGVAHCDINLPDPLPADLFNGLLLPCQHKGNVAPVVPDDIKPVIQEQTQQVTPTDPPVSVSADGSVYLAGVKPGEHMSVFWSGVAHCDINLPDPLPADLFNGLLLPCQHKGNVAPVVPDDIKPVIQEQTQQVTPTDPPVSVSANQ